jgi:hypothetical protein
MKTCGMLRWRYCASAAADSSTFVAQKSVNGRKTARFAGRMPLKTGTFPGQMHYPSVYDGRLALTMIQVMRGGVLGHGRTGEGTGAGGDGEHGDRCRMVAPSSGLGSALHRGHPRFSHGSHLGGMGAGAALFAPGEGWAERCSRGRFGPVRPLKNRKFAGAKLGKISDYLKK